MTLSTHVYVQTEADVHEVFHQCRRLLRCKPEDAFTDGREREWRDDKSYPKPDGHWTLANVPGQGLPALLRVDYRRDGPLRTPEQAAAHSEDCEPGCDSTYHERPCWLDIDFDTSYSYRDRHGGCGELHARLVSQLGRWLDSKGASRSWRNEFSGDVHGGHDRYERLAELCSGGREAETPLHEAVPALDEMDFDTLDPSQPARGAEREP